MQGQSKPANERPGNRWRILGWSSAALLLLVDEEADVPSLDQAAHLVTEAE